MTSQPEKLFRDKLENFQKAAPPLAWDRIEVKLEKPQHKGLWMKMAAGFILLSVAAILLWPKENATDAEGLTKTNTIEPKTEETEVTPEKGIAQSPTTDVAPAKRTNEKKISPKRIKEITQDEPAAFIASHEAIENSEALVEAPVEDAVNEVITVKDTAAPTAIVYTVAEVNARFLKKELPPEATSEEKKSSGIQKLMGLAYDLKNNDTAFGDLRQKKNEILALNFLENKRGQNK